MSIQKPVSIWNDKPWWCQPWSILLTGTSIVGGSWLLLKMVWITLLVSIPILVWWWYFLLVYPDLLKQQIAPDSPEDYRD